MKKILAVLALVVVVVTGCYSSEGYQKQQAEYSKAITENGVITTNIYNGTRIEGTEDSYFVKEPNSDPPICYQVWLFNGTHHVQFITKISCKEFTHYANEVGIK